MPHFLFTAMIVLTLAIAPVGAVATPAALDGGSGGHVC